MGEHQEPVQPVGYMERTRLYYRALGYETDYLWSTFDDVPFTKLKQPLTESKIALITTASPSDLSNRDAAGRKIVWSDNVDPPPEKFVTDVAWDRDPTHTDDRESFLPINAASALALEGVFAGLTEHFVGAPTVYSQAVTMDVHAPEILAKLRADGAGAAILSAL